MKRDSAGRGAGVLVLLGILLPLVVLAAAMLGAVPIGFSQWGSVLGNPFGESMEASVFWEIRLPRVVMAALVGGALALAGAGVQGIFRNPLADPGLIGVSAGASVGAVACFVAGWQDAAGGWALPLMAFFGGLAAVGLLRAFSAGMESGGASKLILAGIALNAMLGSVLGFALFSASDSALRSITFWTLGSCGGANWGQDVVLVVFLAVGVLLLSRNARALDALQFGEAQAAHMGIEVRRVRVEVVVACALLTGAATAFAGMIGFIGLVAPHMARLLVGGLHRMVLPVSVLIGAVLLVAADLGARTLVAPAELSVGILTAAAGGPFFLWLLRRPSARSLE